MSAAGTMLVAVLLEFTHLVIRRKKYGLTVPQFIATYLTIVVTGLLGALVAHYIETGHWGIRYYGTILFVVLSVIPLAKILRIPYGYLMDYVSPEGMLVISIMKINCWVNGCCDGKVLYYTSEGVAVYFPSQAVETFTAIGILLLIVVMEKMPKAKKYIFPVFLLAYSGTRLVFDSLRADQGRMIDLGLLQISVGHIFCAVMIIIGGVDLVKRIKINKIEESAKPVSNTSN